MSFHFYLYRAAEGLGPVNQWTQMHAAPLGSRAEVRDRLRDLFPNTRWDCEGDHWFGLASPLDPYVDIMLGEDSPGQCHFVVMNKAPPSVMRRILEALALNYVCAPEANCLVDPYAYDDNARYFAKRESTASGS